MFEQLAAYGNKLAQPIDSINSPELKKKYKIRSEFILDPHTNKLVTRYKGVSAVRNCWRATIYIDEAKKHLGYFPTRELAAEAYNMEALQVFGKSAILNVIQKPESI
mgnify:CR=1 FL=1